MRVSTYQRHQQRDADISKIRRERIDAAFQKAGLSSTCGGYPINPTDEDAYNAGFQRGCHWVYQAAADRGERISERWDMADSTYAGHGEHDVWNAAAHALSVMT